MQINSRPTHDYDFQWSPGTRVADEFSGEITQAGSEDIEGDAISQALLDKILMEAGFGEAGDDPDWSPLPSACGANALYLVCRLTGKDVSLREIVKALGLREDSEERNVNVETLCGAAKTFGLTPIALRGGTDLLTAPSRAPVIAHAVGRKGRWHYTVIRGFDESSRELRVLDMPFRPLRLKLSTFAKDWSGVAILFHPDDVAHARAAGRHRAMIWACGAAVGAVALTLVGFAIRRRWRRAAARLVEEPSR